MSLVRFQSRPPHLHRSFQRHCGVFIWTSSTIHATVHAAQSIKISQSHSLFCMTMKGLFIVGAADGLTSVASTWLTARGSVNARLKLFKNTLLFVLAKYTRRGGLDDVRNRVIATTVELFIRFSTNFFWGRPDAFNKIQGSKSDLSLPPNEAMFTEVCASRPTGLVDCGISFNGYKCNASCKPLGV